MIPLSIERLEKSVDFNEYKAFLQKMLSASGQASCMDLKIIGCNLSENTCRDHNHLGNRYIGVTHTKQADRRRHGDPLWIEIRVCEGKVNRSIGACLGSYSCATYKAAKRLILVSSAREYGGTLICLTDDHEYIEVVYNKGRWESRKNKNVTDALFTQGEHDAAYYSPPCA